MLAFFYFRDAPLVQPEPRSYIVAPIAPGNHRKDEGSRQQRERAVHFFLLWPWQPPEVAHANCEGTMCELYNLSRTLKIFLETDAAPR